MLNKSKGFSAVVMMIILVVLEEKVTKDKRSIYFERFSHEFLSFYLKTLLHN